MRRIFFSLVLIISTLFLVSQVVNVSAADSITITTASLPGGTVGTAYNLTLAATDPGPGPVVWSISVGVLPEGVTLTTAGVLQGTPTKVGTYPVTIVATDGALTGSKALSLAVTSNTEYPSGTLVKQPGDSTVWLLENQKLHGFRSPTEFLSHGYNWNIIIEITPAELGIYPMGEVVGIQSGSLVKDPDASAVFLVLDSRLHGFTSASIFLDLSYSFDSVYTLLSGELGNYPYDEMMAVLPTHFPYTKVKVASSATVFLLEQSGSNLLKRGIPSAGVFFSRGWRWPDIITISDAEMALYGDGAMLFYRDGSLLKGDASGAVFVMEYGLKRPFASGDNFEGMRYQWSNVLTVSQAEIDSIGLGVEVVPDANKLVLLAERRAAEAAAAAAAAAAQMPFATYYEEGSVATARGTYSYKMVKATRDGTKVETISATKEECGNNCPNQALASYVDQSSGFAGIHGSYFCPPDYSYCSSSRYYFDTPIFDSMVNHWINWNNKDWNYRAALTFSENDYESYYAGVWSGNPDGTFNSWTDRRVPESGMEAGIFNYPLLTHKDNIIASDENTDTKQRTKGARAAVGFNNDYVYLVTISNASVIDAAYVVQALGITDALNLDGGGSTALYYQGAYKAGPGRSLPNAIVLRQR